MKRSFDAIAFDWGGIFTVGTFDGTAAGNLSRATGLERQYLEPIYLRLMADFEVGAFRMPGFHQRFCEATGTSLSLDEFRRVFLGSVHERAAMFDLIKAIPEGYTVGMLSNNSPELCDLVRDDPRNARFDSFVFSNEIGVRKPAAAAFAALTEALGVPPSRTVFIDDNADNIAACEALGFTGLLLDEPRAFAARWRAALPELPLPASLTEAAA